MAQATHAYTTSKFHNLSNEALADAIGQADALLKGVEAEVAAFMQSGDAERVAQNPFGELTRGEPRQRLVKEENHDGVHAGLGQEPKAMVHGREQAGRAVGS